jgi:four helix bundle protein
MSKGFQDLEVWQGAQKLVREIYKLTNSFPKNEQFGIISQIRRAAYPIPANLAEGDGRRFTREFLQFLGFANGSAEELRYFVILGKDLRYISPKDETRLTCEVTGIVQMMAVLTRSLRAPSKEREVLRFSRVTRHGSRDTRPSPELRH